MRGRKQESDKPQQREPTPVYTQSLQK